MKFILKFIIFLGLLVAGAYLLLSLFMPERLEMVKEYIYGEEQHGAANKISSKTLKVGYSFNLEEFEPTNNSPVNRTYLMNIYERLVCFDRNLQIRPALAVSWGRQSDTLWEFKLREDVVFHNGSEFDTEDVITSFERALNHKSSGLKDNLSSIKSVTERNNNIYIETEYPDPLLLQKIASVFVFPSELKKFTSPVGTGPYKYISSKDDKVNMERFDDYWDDLPYYKTVLFQYIPDKFDRISALEDGEIDILANVPPSFAEKLEENLMISLHSLPSLEVNFLLFNTDNENLEDERLRKAIQIAFDKQLFVDNAFGFARISNQFISNGIFGFNPSIGEAFFDLEQCQSLVKECSPFERISLDLYILEGLEGIATFLEESLSDTGLTIKTKFVSFEEFKEAIEKGKGDLYYFGFRSELGDAQDFYENIVLSNGDFNPGYSNKKIDQAIDSLSKNFDQEKRLTQLQNVMKIITEDDIIGVPLFESDVVYGVRIGISFKPRLDGFILVSEIK